MQINFEEILRELNEKAKDISMDNEKIRELISEAKEKMENNEVFSDVSDDIKESMEMLIAWKDGSYTQLSQNTILLLVAGLIYIVNPLGIVPKFLKRNLIGDILIILYILKRIRDELEQYRAWKNQGEDHMEESKTIYIEL